MLNQEYYGHRLALFSRIAFRLEIVIVVGSGTSGVSGWIIWTKYPSSAVLWGIIAAASTLLAALKPVLQTDAKLKRYSSLFSAYRQLAIGMKMVAEDIAENDGITREMNREVERIRARYRTLSVDDDPRPSSKLVTHLQEEINKRVPASSLYYPRSVVGAPAPHAPALPAVAGDANELDTRIDPVKPWPTGKQK